MKLAHAGDNRLTCLLICISSESRVFLCQLHESDCHLLLTCFCLGLDSDLDNGIREFHRLKHDGMLVVAERVARADILQTYCRCNIACLNLRNFLSVVSVHFKDTTHSLTLGFCRVVYCRTGLNLAGVNTEESQLTHEGVSHNLERESRERTVYLGGTSLYIVLISGCVTFDRFYIQRRRHQLYYQIEHGLYTFVAVGRTAANGNGFARDSQLAHCSEDFFFSQLLAAEVFLKQLVVRFCSSFEQLFTIFLSDFLHVVRNLCNIELSACFIACVVENAVHFQQVNDSYEGVLSADGQLEADGVCSQSVFHHFNYIVEVCAEYVHFVDISHSRYAVCLSLSPDCFALRLDAALSAENCNRAVQNL